MFVFSVEILQCALTCEHAQCVILTETNLAVQQRINEHCRARGIAFLVADVRGVFCWSFTDLGDSFVVLDKNGEDPPEVMIESVTKVATRDRSMLALPRQHSHRLTLAL
jgi:hypothetical protein